MRQRDALERALARAGRRLPRWTPPASRLRLRTHRMLLGMPGGVQLHYLAAPRRSAVTRIDYRLTMRLLLTETSAARAASSRAYLVCESQRRDMLRILRTLSSSRILASTQRFFREIRNRYLPSIDGQKAAARRGASIPQSGLTTPRRSAIDASTMAPRFVSMQKDILAAPVWPAIDLSTLSQHPVSARPAVPAETMPPAAGLRTLYGALQLACVSAVETARDALANVAMARHGSDAPSERPATRRWLRLLDQRAHAMPGQTTTRRTTAARQASTHATTRMKRLMAWTRGARAPGQGPAALRPGTPGERTTARLSAFRLSTLRPIDTATAGVAPTASATMQFRATMRTTHAVSASAMPRSHANTPSATLRYRCAPRAAAPDAKHQASQQQVVRQVTQELVQNTPWRGQLEQAVLAPRVLRELTERVAGAIAGRQGLERYRRGL